MLLQKPLIARALLLLIPLLGGFPLEAKMVVTLKTPSGEQPLAAEEKKGKVWVDLEQAARALGAQKYEILVKQDAFVQMEFSSYTLALNPKDHSYSIRLKGGKKWDNAALPDPVLYDQTRPLVSLESLPSLFQKKFTYHRQKRRLEEQAAVEPPKKDPYRSLAVRFKRVDQKIWVAVDDLAKALGVVMFSSQANRYNLVMPDFNILELVVEQPWAYRKNQRYKLLEEPVFLFAGSPYITVASAQSIFEIEMLWEKGTKTLRVPAAYGRLRDIEVPEVKPVTYIGYYPEPFRFTVDEMSVFYQNPGPTYPAEHRDVFESASDPFNRAVVDPDTSGYDRISSHFLGGIKGSLLGRPLEGRGEFEKIGTRGEVINGNVRWGFPRLQVMGGREYLRMAGLNNQFESVDQITVSHSNDAFGENQANPEATLSATYGTHKFSVFMSTSEFSQTAEFRQDVFSQKAEWSREINGRQHVDLTFNQFFFKNNIREISSGFLQTEFFDEFLDEFEPIKPDPSEENALASTVLTPNHAASLLDATYRLEGIVQLSATGALSYFRDMTPDRPWVTDEDWRLRAILGKTKSRLDASYEQAGPRYRTIGDPVRYQNRNITRLSPYLDITRVWKMYGQFRRENIGVLETLGQLEPYRNDYIYGGSLLNLSKNAVRTSYTQLDNGLSGKIKYANMDFTQYFGRDALDVGAGWRSQANTEGKLSLQGYTGKLSYQILRPNWKLTVGEELTRLHSRRLRADRWETATNILFGWKKYKALAEYRYEPKFITSPDVLYTGYLQLGRQAGKNKVMNLFFAATSLHKDLKYPEVWRMGLEYVNDFF